MLTVKRSVLTLAVWVYGSSVSPTSLAAEAQDEASLLPAGKYAVQAIRRSGAVQSTPDAEPNVGDLFGNEAVFGETFQWIDGTHCKTWSTKKIPNDLVDLRDPNLSDLTIDKLEPLGRDVTDLAQTFEINCEGDDAGPVTTVMRVDDRIIVTVSASGSFYLILEKPLSEEQVVRLQRQLKVMKFYDGELSGVMDARTRAGVAGYADYRGARYRFKDAVISENLLDGLGVVETERKSQDAKDNDNQALKTVHLRDISAHFFGTTLALGKSEYGVNELKFEFKDDDELYQFRPQGELFFSDWQFEIFSPDGTYVHLLQDRFGPYHIVHIDNLRAYLLHERDPDHVVGRVPKGDQPASVHSDATWLSDSVFQYTVTCCGSPEVETFQIPTD